MPKRLSSDDSNNAIQAQLAIAGLQKDIVYMREKIDEMNDKMDDKFVTQDEFKAKFDPISKIVYGIVAIIVTTVVGALLSVVINK
jgi:hypothetical protein